MGVPLKRNDFPGSDGLEAWVLGECVRMCARLCLYVYLWARVSVCVLCL